MPVQKKQGSLAAKLGAKLDKAIKAHKDDEVRLGGGGDLPSGIEMGIAQLTEFKFGEYKDGPNKGEPFCYAAGIVKAPHQAPNGLPIVGLRTQYGPEPLCETKSKDGKVTTLDQHIDRVLNEMRKLGVDTKQYDGGDWLEGQGAMLKEAKPHFRFRTWSNNVTTQYPNPKTFHDWKGACEYNGEGENLEVDNTGGDDSTGSEEVQTEAVEGASWEADDLDDLAVAADGNDPEAAAKLAERAAELDIDSDAQPSWEAVVELIKAQMAGGGDSSDDGSAAGSQEWEVLGELADSDEEDADHARSQLEVEAQRRELDPDAYGSWSELAAVFTEPEAEAAAFEPKKGEVVKYKPKGVRKTIDCEIMLVFEKAQTVSLKSLSDGKLYKAIPWAELSE